ncbi:MAG: hypothetical protein RMJ37_08035 [Spirochaetia bacterium]|nr:hypothetical protein [Spirochaetota bacterium]MDW8113263.1 hypothetical protein [Spirochaetia bacterium]
MRRIILRVWGVLTLVAFLVVAYLVGEYIYLKVNFEKVDSEVREYQDIPYLNRRLASVESEYIRLKEIESETRTPALVLGNILRIFSKYDVDINSINREQYEEGEVYKTSVSGKFRNIFLSLGEIESSFIPISISRIYITGDSENVSMVMSFVIAE